MGGDSTPFESDNYNPIDARAGRPENVDAQPEALALKRSPRIDH